jgi:hypothetical protein
MEYDENGMCSENVFNFPTIMTEQVTSVTVVTGTVLAPFKRGLRWAEILKVSLEGDMRSVQCNVTLTC